MLYLTLEIENWRGKMVPGLTEPAWYIHTNVRNDKFYLCLYRDLTFISALPFLVYFSYYNQSDPSKTPLSLTCLNFSVTTPLARRIQSRFFIACFFSIISDDLPPFLHTPSTSVSSDVHCLELCFVSLHLYVCYPSFPFSLNGTSSRTFSFFLPP